MNILAMKFPKRTKDVAQLWVIRKLEYTTLVINQNLTFTIKLYLTNDNCTTLRMILKNEATWANIGSFLILNWLSAFQEGQKRFKS